MRKYTEDYIKNQIILKFGSIQEFAEHLGTHRQNIYDKIKRFTPKFEKLLYDEGILTRESNSKQKLNNQMSTKLIPIVSEVYAGIPDRIDIVSDESIPYVVDNPYHRYCAVKIIGNSMESTLRDGDIAIIDFDAEFKDGDIVVVKLRDGSQYIKRYYNVNYAFIKLTSDNPDYGVRMIDKNDIEVIHKVIGVQYLY